MLLSGLLSVAAFVNSTKEFRQLHVLIREASVSIPEFSIRSGIAYSQLSQPVYANTNQFPIVLDLEGKDHPEKKFVQGVAIRKEGIWLWTDPSKLKILFASPQKPMVYSWKEWPAWPDGVVNTAYIDQLLKKKFVPVLPIFIPLFWVAIGVFGVIQALFFSGLSGFLERAMTPGFTFRQLFNLSIFAMTPGSIIVAVYSMLDVDVIRSDLVYFVSFCFVFVMASDACRSILNPPKDEEPEEE
jgi:hypothetical protein